MTKTNWWYSLDEKRGFCWDEVIGYDYKEPSNEGGKPALYLYLKAGIYHLVAEEAKAI